MNCYKDKVLPSIKRALTLITKISNLPEVGGEGNISAYKAALLCRMEVQYSIALLKLQTDHQIDLSKIEERSKADANRTVQLLESSLDAPSPEEALQNLYQVDLFLGALISRMRRKLRPRHRPQQS